MTNIVIEQYVYGETHQRRGRLKCGFICHVENKANISDLHCKETEISNMLSYQVLNKDQ